MHTVKIDETFESSLDNVWDYMTNLNNQLWRTNIKDVQIIDDFHFIEFDNDGYETHFTITNKVKNDIYEFDIQNQNIKGHWIGRLRQIDNHYVHIEFTEIIHVHNKIMNLFAKNYLKKQQQQYIADLKNVLQR